MGYTEYLNYSNTWIDVLAYMEYMEFLKEEETEQENKSNINKSKFDIIME